MIAHALAPYVTDSSFVEQTRKPPRANSHRGQHVGVGGLVARRLVRNRCLGLFGHCLSVRKVEAHTAPEAACAGVISGDDRAGTPFCHFDSRQQCPVFFDNGVADRSP